jgi:hypothetical protein
MVFLSKKKYENLSKEISDIASKLDGLNLKERPEGEYDLLNDEDAKRKVAYALNLCTVSVSQIIDYHDIYILEQEYDAILNNINIQKFVKDDALLAVLKQILDVITFFRIQEGDKEYIEKEYQHKLKNAIWNAVPNLCVLFTGGGKMDWKSLAITAAVQVGIGYMNYRKAKSQYIFENEKNKWELQRSALEQFNGLRRELFEAAWRLSKTYNFDEKYRLTEKQITQYDFILLDQDPLRRYERLDVISHYFQAFPPYWYHKGSTAREIYLSLKDENIDVAGEYKRRALLDYEKFDEIYREDMELMREDIIASSCFLEHIFFLDNKKDTEKIDNLLTRAIRLAGDNLDVLQQCVFHYTSLAIYEPAYYDKVIDILRRLINEDYNANLNGQILSRVYFNHSKDKVSYDILSDRVGKENVIPWVEDDEEAHAEYLVNNYYNILNRFNTFIECYYNKYEIKFNKLIPYKFVDPDTPDLVYRLENIDLRKHNIDEILGNNQELFYFIGRLNIVPRFIELSNEMFDNLFKSELFIMTDIEENKWKNFFDNVAQKMKSTIKQMDENYKEIDGTIKGVQNSNQGELIKKMIDICEFDSYSEVFFVEIIKEFTNHLTYHLKEKCPQIDAALDVLFSKNNIVIPNVDKGDDSDDAVSLSTRFFEYIGDKSDNNINNNDFPIFNASNAEVLSKIKLCIGDKIKKITKNTQRIYFRKDLDDRFINKFYSQVKKIKRAGAPIIPESIIAVVDTTLINDLGWGIWFCYDGMYLRKAMHTDYISYNEIEKRSLKKPSDMSSAIIFEKRSSAKIEYEDHSINKDILIQIIDGIKNIIAS